MLDLNCAAIEKHIIIPLSMEWWQVNVICMLTIVGILFVCRFFSQPQLKKISYIIGALLCFRILFIQLYQMQINVWNFETSIPLHLCGLSSILSGLVLFRNSQFAYECLFYWGIAGALQSFLTPQLNLGNSDTILYLDYFISHSGIIFSALFLTLVIGMRPRENSWFKVFLFSQLLIPIIGGVNIVINNLIVNGQINHCATVVGDVIKDGANYMYLYAKPEVDNPLLIGDWPYYIIFIELIALVHFWLLYQPIRMLKK